jgi:hypothetical protein
VETGSREENATKQSWSVFERSGNRFARRKRGKTTLERFQAKWEPVRVKKTRQNKAGAFSNIERWKRSDRQGDCRGGGPSGPPFAFMLKRA